MLTEIWTLVILLTAVNYLGVKLGGLVQDIFTIAKVGAMLLLVLGAFLLPTGGSVANLTASSTSWTAPDGSAWLTTESAMP